MEIVRQPKIIRTVIEKVWAKNKYDIMARGYEYYKSISKGLRQGDLDDVFELLVHTRSTPYKKKAVINTCEHIWGYFKNKASAEEKGHFFQLLRDCKNVKDEEFQSIPNEMMKVMDYVRYLLVAYPNDYLQGSYFLFSASEWNEVVVKHDAYVWKDYKVWIKR